jgi:hypothetical protein
MEITSIDPASARRRIWREPWLIAGLILITIAGITSPIWGIWLIWKRRLSQADQHNRAELDRRRERYEAVVRQISAMDVKQEIGHPIYFEIAADRDPTTLRLCNRDESPAKVNALWKEGRLIEGSRVNGELRLRFITADFGAWGVFSLIYSSTAAPLDERSGDGWSVAQIDPHWHAYWVLKPRDR